MALQAVKDGPDEDERREVNRRLKAVTWKRIMGVR